MTDKPKPWSGYKPCPFCGEAINFKEIETSHGHAVVKAVMCKMCRAVGPTGIDYEDAAEQWNRRA